MPEMPDWVQVWAWLRFIRDPRDMTPLPQQEPDPNTMSRERFDELSAEWIAKGSPSMSMKKLVAVMTGAAGEELPF